MYPVISDVTSNQRRENAMPQPDAAVFKNALVEFASTVSAVAAYHPLRTIAVQLLNNQKINFAPSNLYRGFSYGCLAAHQLFLMGFLVKALKEEFGLNDGPRSATWTNMGIGMLSGALTTATTTPFEVMTIRKQNNDVNQYPLSMLYRGIIPQVMRQMGLGAGMFAFPNCFASKAEEIAPELYEQYPKVVKTCGSFFGGSLAAVFTQIPEIARMLLQSDPNGKNYPSTSSAMKEASKQIFTTKGGHLFAIRLAVLIVATIVMNVSREIYSAQFSTEK